MISNNQLLIAAHYQHCWTVEGLSKQWKQGPIWQLPPDFNVLVFPPHGERTAWTYATCGMSQQGDASAIELHLFSQSENDLHVELLTAIAHYHLTGEYLDVGHTVNFGRPWFENSKCDHGLISLPYLDGPKLEWLNSKQKIRFLWLIPITSAEVDFAKTQGLEALESKFEAANFNYLDPKRASVV